MAPSPYTPTYTLFGKTDRNTHNFAYPPRTSTDHFGVYKPSNYDAARTAVRVILGKFPDKTTIPWRKGTTLGGHHGRWYAPPAPFPNGLYQQGYSLVGT